MNGEVTAAVSHVHGHPASNLWICSAVPPSPKFPKPSSPWGTWTPCSSRRRSATLTASRSPTCTARGWGTCSFTTRTDTWVLPNVWMSRLNSLSALSCCLAGHRVAVQRHQGHAPGIPAEEAPHAAPRRGETALRSGGRVAGVNAPFAVSTVFSCS